MAEQPEVALLDEVAHSLTVAGVIIAGLTGLMSLVKLASAYQASAEIAVVGLWMWGIGVCLMDSRRSTAYSNPTPS